MNRSQRSFVAILCLLVSFSSVSWGWGRTGHEVVEVVAAQIMPASPLARLLKSNLTNIQQISMVPDIYWKHGTTPPNKLEGQSHFFNFDFYHPQGGAPQLNISYYLEKFGRAAILEHGSAPWRVGQLTGVLVRAMKRPQVSPDEVIQIAATLGHYIGDLGNPLHCTLDYDGVAAGVKGLHSYFETKTINEYFTEAQLRELVTQASVPMFNSMPDEISPVEIGLGMAIASYESAQPLLAMASKLKLTPELSQRSKPLIVKTLATSAATLAKVWHEAWVLAGQPDFNTAHIERVQFPEWVPVNYLRANKH
ncbi:MAG: S1/P1 nuclease [Oligoflexia bacterium]|nr:S1/P1 nuclease [Oligoflexia bacterium]